MTIGRHLTPEEMAKILGGGLVISIPARPTRKEADDRPAEKAKDQS